MRYKGRILRCIAAVLAAAVLVGAVLWIHDRIRRGNAEQEFRALRTLRTENDEVRERRSETVGEVMEESETEKSGEDITHPKLDWAEIRKKNPDIYAWIEIPGTKVDYPILQHPTEDSYYLDHNLDGSCGYPGCIFTERCNATDFSDRITVIYGHNMKDGTMFRSLHWFEDAEFFEVNRYCYIYLPSGETLVYEIIACYVSSDEHIPELYDCDSEEGENEYLRRIRKEGADHGTIREDIQISDAERILTLSTCIREDDERLLVQALYRSSVD